MFVNIKIEGLCLARLTRSVWEMLSKAEGMLNNYPRVSTALGTEGYVVKSY